ncbi:hypothetical protein [Nodularia sp. UHCC 0506]|uniref:hypothetical protein n=1 Tax=Nodularia sp. UHCC 0506 TaxID=3110243 RepID=UPI002B1EA1F3|nr:hypothetical protein [Nodularia sp. UHCC 0506]MEA5515771.1 hypothetical protein [Nodularia sp. UHCC 0506]
MVTTIAKRIQSKLSRQGIKISLGEIRPIYNEIVSDTEHPTDEEITAIFEHLMANATKLTVIEEQPQPVVTDHEESNSSEDVNNLYTSSDTTPQAEETETPICAGGELGNTATPAQMESETLENPEDVGAIALQETSELVASTAESMGITLNIEDVTAIASNFDYASTNSDDELEEIKTAITTFVQHKAALSRQKIQHIVQEVKQTIHNLDAENSELLNDGLRSISQDIKSGSERFRQQTRQALKVFALPPTKAG